MGDNLVQVDRLEILSFFDNPPFETGRHSNAIVAIAGEELGIGLVKHYFWKNAGIPVDILPGPRTRGTPSGSRLDRWILVHWPDCSVQYQVEIKNWSANSLNGKRLHIDAEPDIVCKHKVERWECEWDHHTQTLKKRGTMKVLTPMKPNRSELIERIEPLLCMWDAMHPTGEPAPWFSVSLPANCHFQRLNVFSMSAYLRSISDDFLTIDMPDTLQRLSVAKRIFPSCL
jgi:hypothetical protein